MKHTPNPQTPSRAARRRADTLFNKKVARDLKAMQKREVRPGVLDFPPVRRERKRQSGWTPKRQRAFVEALADTACVTTAAKMVGLSPRSAYTLRRHPSAFAFRIAWDRAMDHAAVVMADNATARAVNGYKVKRYYQGEVVGEDIRFDERLVTRLLASRNPGRFGREVDLTDSDEESQALSESFDTACDLLEVPVSWRFDPQQEIADMLEETGPLTPAQQLCLARQRLDRNRLEHARRRQQVDRLFDNSLSASLAGSGRRPAASANARGSGDQLSPQGGELCELNAAKDDAGVDPPGRSAGQCSP